MKIKNEKQLIEFLAAVAKKGVREAINDPARDYYLEKMKEEESVYGKLGEVEEPAAAAEVEEPAAAAEVEEPEEGEAEEEEVDVKGEIDKKIDKTLNQIDLEDGVNYDEFLIVANLFRSTKSLKEDENVQAYFERLKEDEKKVLFQFFLTIYELASERSEPKEEEEDLHKKFIIKAKKKQKVGGDSEQSPDKQKPSDVSSEDNTPPIEVSESYIREKLRSLMAE
jgi:hypothetical protein